MAWNLTVKTQPATEPITLTEAKAHLRVDFTDDDTYISGLISVARSTLEWAYDRAFITQTLVLTLDRFVQPATPLPSWGAGAVAVSGWGPAGTQWGWYAPTWSVIELRPPVQQINAITYVDPTGATQTLDPTKYTLTKSEPGRVFPSLNNVWPVTALQPGAASIEFVAGYTSEANIPAAQLQAMKLILADLYEHREQSTIEPRISTAVELPYGVQELMAPWAPILIR